jgi:CubicO group peptidase (beta-lactamase class C family)
MSDVNEKVSELIKNQVKDGRQIGVQVCAYQYGKKIVDAWAGKMGPDDPRPIQADSLFCSWSTTKGVTATAIHMLADRGLLDYNTKVTDYWPEFGQNGKEDVTVTQALSHQIGLHFMPEPLTLEWLCDWDAGIEYVEKAKPAYPPGTQTGYHAHTFGLIAGGIVEAVTGKHIKEFIQEEIAKPLSIEDEMYVGIPDGLEERLTTLEIWDIPSSFREIGYNVPEGHEFYKAMPNHMWSHWNKMELRKACIPAGNGHFTARALAKMYGALAADGSINGVKLVSPDRIHHMNRMVTDRVDIVVSRKIRRSIGFILGGIQNGIHGPIGPRLTAFGHSGAGGSVAFADPKEELAIAVTLNKMEMSTPDKGRTLEICNLIRKELDAS